MRANGGLAYDSGNLDTVEGAMTLMLSHLHHLVSLALQIIPLIVPPYMP